LSKRSIEIDRLEVRLTEISSEAARTAVAGLGQELLQRLASLSNAEHRKGTQRISEIDSGTLTLAKGTSPAALRHAIAQKITSSIQSKLGSPNLRRSRSS
jgi:hypothetical protein